MGHGDVMGDCPAIQGGRFSDIFQRNRTDYYNTLYYSQDQVSYSRSILDYALSRLTNSRQQLVYMQNNNYPVADIQRREATVVDLEQNVSVLETVLGVAATLIANKLQ
jgi:arginine repressor